MIMPLSSQSIQMQLKRQVYRGSFGVSSSRLVSSFFGFGNGQGDASQNQSISSTSRNLSSKTFNKQNIIKEVATTHELSAAKSERIVNTVFDTIVEAVVDGKQVRVSSFGSFDSYLSKARKGRNPSNGEEIDIEAKKRIRFKAYDAFKKASNDS